MAELPAMPTLVERIIADTTYMTDGEVGCYARLLWTMWAKGGYLPNDKKELARICGVTPAKFERRWKTLIQHFEIGFDTITQKRLMDVWLNVQALRRKRSDAAAETNAKRWGRSAMRPASQSATRSPNRSAYRNQIREDIDSTLPSISANPVPDSPPTAATKSVASPQLAAALQTRGWTNGHDDQ